MEYSKRLLRVSLRRIWTRVLRRSQQNPAYPWKVAAIVLLVFVFLGWVVSRGWYHVLVLGVVAGLAAGVLGEILKLYRIVRGPLGTGTGKWMTVFGVLTSPLVSDRETISLGILIAGASVWVLLLISSVWVSLWFRVAGLNKVRCYFTVAASLISVVAAIRLYSEFDGLLLVYLFCLLFAMAVGSQVVGRISGDPVTLPTVNLVSSKNGVVGALLSGYLLCFVLVVTKILPLETVHLWILTTVLMVVAIFGEFYVSSVKFMQGTRFSGSYPPFRGGILDRSSMLLPTLPVAALYLILIG